MNWRKPVFFLLIAFCLTPFTLPPLAITAGLIFALIFENPYPQHTKKAIQIFFVISVIFLGFGFDYVYLKNSLNLGYVLLIIFVVSTLLIGFLIIRFLKPNPKTYSLTAAAIAVSGKNAISAISPTIDVEENDSSPAVSTIFLINLTAIFIFPIAGYLLNLTVYQYGVWTAIAIPDTLFALNSATIFGAESLKVASANNIVRLLFLIPIAYIFAYFYKDTKFSSPKIPWLLFLFFVPIIIRHYAPVIIPISFYDVFVNLAKAGFTITLFLTGIEFSRQTIKDADIKSLIFGFLLWSLLAIASLIAVIRLV